MKATDLKPLRIFGHVRTRPKRLPPTKATLITIGPNAARVKYPRGQILFTFDSQSDLDAIIEKMEKLLNFKIIEEEFC